MHPEEQEEGADQARVRLLHEVVQVFAILRRHLHACASKRHRLSLRLRLALRAGRTNELLGVVEHVLACELEDEANDPARAAE